MSTPNNTAPDFGEPWQNELGDFEIYPRTGGDAVAYAEGAKTRDRVIACVNACAGMANPAAEIQAMRDAVKEARELLASLEYEGNEKGTRCISCGSHCSEPHKEGCNMLSALSKLKTLA